MLSRLEVTAAYRAILHREPENDLVIDHHRDFDTLAALCKALVESDEFGASLVRRHGAAPTFGIDDLDRAALDFREERKDRWRGYVLRLPEWFEEHLDPDGDAYRAQMLRFWSDITARPNYLALTHEDTPEIKQADAIYRPAFYASGDPAFAGGQLMAMGHILMRSGIRAGDRILEYGAGFGQTALAFARLGAKVDTVDINPAFCRTVRTSARRYRVDLHAHVGEFGYNPSGQDHAYDLIFFYESFHHCLDFVDLIARFRRLLKPGGRVILAGEPIFADRTGEMPYPWGFRLDWENLAVMRIRGWLELGFQKEYLLGKFADTGFRCAVHTDPNSHWAQIYEFLMLE